ncbi:MAG: transcription-repair coupling factor, partial [Rhodothermales bacterium]|nr:transcription-repair coupling factor [Rhodothermales bacterium]
SHRSFLDSLSSESAVVVMVDEDVTIANTTALFESSVEAYRHFVERHPHIEAQKPEFLFQSGDDLRESIQPFRRITTGTFSSSSNSAIVDLKCSPQPDFNSSIELLKASIDSGPATTFILCDSKGQQQRLTDLLETQISSGKVSIVVGSLHEGFVVDDSQLAVFTDHQIFNRFHRPSTRKKKSTGGLSLRALKDLSVGDFVVHVDYGIGTFDGLKKITVRGKEQEAAKILYKDRDSLFVNVNSIHKLHKYSGKDGHQPGLTKLGTGQWERKKARTKKRVKDIARDLIKLYAQRRAASGHAFPPDTIWQREMEASFQYEDTPDQSKAIDFVKEDMMQPSPMDRLVCGDVGFGKTEVAVRAAFKAVQDGRQVAILVPTTILAEQHLETFSKRLARFPVRIAALSRFRDPQEQKQIIKDVASGKIDVLIGTHRITSKDVVFKDLGLLVIDEEQRFGVSIKEKLRKLKVNVDTLTLTATPIPRTLQFSLLGARDLSIISTPPPNRQPIVTEIHTYDSELIRDAIVYELNRGGQVFFIHNRVKSIEEMGAKLRDTIPGIRLRVAHGQMPPRTLENVMFDFKNHKFDVLLSTNIIENGLDISNANTIIINHANRFGLAELHQLRGRVGRSDRKAFCYLLVSSIHSLTREARQRLQALEEFSNLGAGFGLAMRDMDIRGAGNMLGAEQSGFIADVGFETYHKILDEAVSELRQDEFKELFKDQPTPALFETAVDVDVDALIPMTYLSSNNERLNLYRRIAEAKNTEELHAISSEMTDRFGPFPEQVNSLFIASRLKLIGQILHLPRITYKNSRLFLNFPDQKASDYFSASLFQPVMEWLDESGQRFVMKQSKQGTMRAIVQEVNSLGDAMTLCEELVEHVTGTENEPQL